MEWDVQHGPRSCFQSNGPRLDLSSRHKQAYINISVLRPFPEQSSSASIKYQAGDDVRITLRNGSETARANLPVSADCVEKAAQQYEKNLSVATAIRRIN